MKVQKTSPEKSLIKLGADENIVAVDQLAPVNNIGRYSSFFDTLITFVIDRDPRDLFLLNKPVERR